MFASPAAAPETNQIATFYTVHGQFWWPSTDYYERVSHIKAMRYFYRYYGPRLFFEHRRTDWAQAPGLDKKHAVYRARSHSGSILHE